MKLKFSQILNQKNLFILKENNTAAIDRYSLKERDFRGSRFIDHQTNLSGAYNILPLSNPGVVSEIHERFLKAGADILSSNTTKSNKFFLEKYKLQDIAYELNLASIKLIKNKTTKYSSITRNKPRYAAGSISSITLETDPKKLTAAYREQITALLAGGADFIHFCNVNSHTSLTTGLNTYNNIMAKRKKIGELTITLEKTELEKNICQKKFVEQFPNLKFIAIGHNININDNIEDKFKSIKQLFPVNICSVSPKNEITENDAIKFVDEITKHKNIKILSLGKWFSQNIIKKISDNEQ